METLNLNNAYGLFDQFLTDLPQFPVSSTTPTVQYDTGKLIKILQKKEVMDICGVQEAELDVVDAIDIELGKVVRDLVMGKDPQQAIDTYHKMEKRIENEVPDVLYLYSRQGALSVKSLYYYKIGEWQKAITITLECIALNDYLIQQGIHTLNLRVYEQNKNISRIHFRAGQFEEGHRLLNNLFDYMLNGNDKPLHGNVFKHPLYWQKVPIIRETYAYEMFNMIVEDMIRFHIDKTDQLFPSDWYKGLEFEVDNPNRQVLYNWIYVNNQLQNGDLEGFFESLKVYFEMDISQYYDILKIALLLEVTKLIQQSNYPNKTNALLQIEQFIDEKIETQERLRKKVIELCFRKNKHLTKLAS